MGDQSAPKHTLPDWEVLDAVLLLLGQKPANLRMTRHLLETTRIESVRRSPGETRRDLALILALAVDPSFGMGGLNMT